MRMRMSHRVQGAANGATDEEVARVVGFARAHVDAVAKLSEFHTFHAGGGGAEVDLWDARFLQESDQMLFDMMKLAMATGMMLLVDLASFTLAERHIRRMRMSNHPSRDLGVRVVRYVKTELNTDIAYRRPV
jgi:hypothetical protein